MACSDLRGCHLYYSFPTDNNGLLGLYTPPERFISFTEAAVRNFASLVMRCRQSGSRMVFGKHFGTGSPVRHSKAPPRAFSRLLLNGAPGENSGLALGRPGNCGPSRLCVSNSANKPLRDEEAIMKLKCFTSAVYESPRHIV